MTADVLSWRHPVELTGWQVTRSVTGAIEISFDASALPWAPFWLVRRHARSQLAKRAGFPLPDLPLVSVAQHRSDEVTSWEFHYQEKDERAWW